jgi:hypothetical protein
MKVRVHVEGLQHSPFPNVNKNVSDSSAAVEEMWSVGLSWASQTSNTMIKQDILRLDIANNNTTLWLLYLMHMLS